MLATWHTHRDPNGDALGIPPSPGDLHSLAQGNKGKYSIIEAGSKRFGIEVVDVKKFGDFVESQGEAGLTRMMQDAFNKQDDSLSYSDMHWNALKEMANREDSGFKVYRSVDENKLRFSED